MWVQAHIEDVDEAEMTRSMSDPAFTCRAQTSFAADGHGQRVGLPNVMLGAVTVIDAMRTARPREGGGSASMTVG